MKPFIIISTLTLISTQKVWDLRAEKKKKMKFLFQCPCCSCFCFVKPKKGQAKVKEVKEQKEVKEEVKETKDEEKKTEWNFVLIICQFFFSLFLFSDASPLIFIDPISIMHVQQINVSTLNCTFFIIWHCHGIYIYRHMYLWIWMPSLIYIAVLIKNNEIKQYVSNYYFCAFWHTLFLWLVSVSVFHRIIMCRDIFWYRYIYCCQKSFLIMVCVKSSILHKFWVHCCFTRSSLIYSRRR